MFKKLLNYIKNSKVMPTEGWSFEDKETPHLDTASGAVGLLQFGDDLEKAKSYGKPDDVGWLEGGAFKLVYAKEGFQLEFDHEKLSAVAYFVGPDEFNPKSSALR